MARRRMISNEITGSYNFQSMEPKTQLLYFYCCLSADDDGFVGNPYIYTILTGCSENDLETLEQRGFVIRFASGVLAVVHWYIHNTIKKDRYNPTVHKAEHAQLRLEDKCYVRAPQPETERNQNGTKTEPQYSPVKSSPVKASQVKPSQSKASQVKASQSKAIGSQRRITEIRTELSKEVFFLFFRMIIYFLQKKYLSVNPPKKCSKQKSRM
ncbi:MAG: hypothetical protein IIV05_01655, partial [Ruminococcus sp.]|nr:hypothetical protein [Ruminococcus sp.]